MLLLVLLCGACAFLVRANTTDAQLGVLAPSLLLSILRQMETMEKDRAQDRAQDKLDRAQDKQELLQAIGEVSDAVVTAATSDRVYACARGAAVLLHTKWAELASPMQCSAFPLFSEQPQKDSTIFLTSAHCFGNTTRDGAAFASTTKLYFRSMLQPLTCSLAHNFFCHPSAPAACTAAAPSMDLAIVRCAEPVPVPSTRLSALPPQHFQRAFLYGYSDGLNLDPGLEFEFEGEKRRSVLHLKLVRLAPPFSSRVRRASATAPRCSSSALHPPLLAPVGRAQRCRWPATRAFLTLCQSRA